MGLAEPELRSINFGWGRITYVPTYSGFLYLSVVIDAFTRRVTCLHLPVQALQTGRLETQALNTPPKDAVVVPSSCSHPYYSRA